MPKHEPVEPKLDIAAEMRDVEARLIQWEKDVQSGADLDPHHEAQQRIRRERALNLLKHRSDFRQVCSKPEGRRVMYRVMQMAQFFAISHVPGDSHSTAFNDGMRAVGRELLIALDDADDGLFMQMQREHASDLKTEIERKRKEMEEIE